MLCLCCMRLLYTQGCVGDMKSFEYTNVNLDCSSIRSDWSGAWLLLAIVTRTVNSIVSEGCLRKILIMRIKWNLFSKSHSL